MAENTGPYDLAAMRNELRQLRDHRHRLERQLESWPTVTAAAKAARTDLIAGTSPQLRAIEARLDGLRERVLAARRFCGEIAMNLDNLMRLGDDDEPGEGPGGDGERPGGEGVVQVGDAGEVTDELVERLAEHPSIVRMRRTLEELGALRDTTDRIDAR